MKNCILLLSIFVMACSNSKNREPGTERSNVSNNEATAPTEVAAPVYELAEPPSILKDENFNPEDESEITEDYIRTEFYIEKKIIRNAEYTIKAKDISRSKEYLNKIVQQYSAYYQKDQLKNDLNTIAYRLVIRVPGKNFDQLINALEGSEDEILMKNVYSDDVTEEFVDIQSRLKNKREYLEQYRNLLHKAQKIDDILEVEEHIRAIQEEIESKEGRLKYLNDQVAFSTITIELVKDKPYVYKPVEADKFSERFKKSVSNGWRSTVDLVIWFFSVWPSWIILGVIYVIFRRFRKKRRNLASKTNQ